MKLLRRFFVFLIVAAYIGAANLAPMVYAHTPDMSSAMMHEHGGGDKMPCKGAMHGCISELGCIFLVSVPTPDLTLATTTAWLSVTYTGTTQTLRGRSIEPALGPPISFA